jgi:hypothetical protein
MVVYLYKKGRQTMKNIITTIAMFILAITAQAQVYKLEKFYNFKHDALWMTPYAVNNDLDTSLGGTETKAVLKINKKTIKFKDITGKKTYNYVVDSVENILDLYVIYHTKNKEFDNKEFTFFVIKDGDNTLIYDSWMVGSEIKQGWQAVAK